MIRIVASALPALALAACASSTPAPIEYSGSRPPPLRTQEPPQPQVLAPSLAPSPPPTPQSYLAAPPAPVAQVLFLCGGAVSNAGPVSEAGEAMLFTPWIYAEGGLVLMRNPTQGACFSSGFGVRTSELGVDKPHQGIDLANPTGGFVYAAGNGQVVSVGVRGDYGLTVEIDHGAGVHTLYAHLAEVDPSLGAGSLAIAGRPIARMGRTGNATGVNLHYEVMLYGLRIDPMTYGAAPPATTPVS